MVRNDDYNKLFVFRMVNKVTSEKTEIKWAAYWVNDLNTIEEFNFCLNL